MLEEIRLKVMNMLRIHEDEARLWKHNYSQHAIDIYNDNRTIAQRCRIDFNGDDGYEIADGVDKHTVRLAQGMCTCRSWDVSGIPCPHAIKALSHAKQDPMAAIHWWYSKEAYCLVYKHKIQPVRGEKFWRVSLEQAMEPPPFVNQAGRPRTKRRRGKNEAKKRQGGTWTASRRGLAMTCGYCSEPGHNIRRCPLALGKHKHFFQEEQDVCPSAPQPSQPGSSQGADFVFMPTPGYIPQTVRQPTTQSAGLTQGECSKQAAQKGAGKSKGKAKAKAAGQGIDKAPIPPSRQSARQASRQAAAQPAEEVPAPLDNEAFYENEPVIKPPMISEAETRIEAKKRGHINTGSRKIQFVGPDNMPKNLSYQPNKVTWKGNEAMTTSQLNAIKEKKIGKLKSRKAKKN